MPQMFNCRDAEGAQDWVQVTASTSFVAARKYAEESQCLDEDGDVMIVEVEDHGKFNVWCFITVAFDVEPYEED